MKTECKLVRSILGSHGLHEVLLSYFSIVIIKWIKGIILRITATDLRQTNKSVQFNNYAAKIMCGVITGHNVMSYFSLWQTVIEIRLFSTFYSIVTKVTIQSQIIAGVGVD